MSPFTTSWSCQRCGAAYISPPPEHGLCATCAADTGTPAPPAHPDQVICPRCGAVALSGFEEALRDAWLAGAQWARGEVTVLPQAPPGAARSLRKRRHGGERR